MSRSLSRGLTPNLRLGPNQPLESSLIKGSDPDGLAEADDEPAVDVVAEHLLGLLVRVGVDRETAVRNLPATVGSANRAEPTRDAPDIPRNRCPATNDQRWPGAGTCPLAPDLAAGALLDVPEIERFLAPGRQDRPENVVAVLDDRRLGRHARTPRREGDRCQDGEYGEGHELHRESCTARTASKTSRTARLRQISGVPATRELLELLERMPRLDATNRARARAHDDRVRHRPPRLVAHAAEQSAGRDAGRREENIV